MVIHTLQYMCGRQRTIWESEFSSQFWHLGYLTQVIMCAGKCFYHRAPSKFIFSICYYWIGMQQGLASWSKCPSIFKGYLQLTFCQCRACDVVIQWRPDHGGRVTALDFAKNKAYTFWGLIKGSFLKIYTFRVSQVSGYAYELLGTPKGLEHQMWEQ